MTRVAVFLPSLAGGGAERVTLALADGLTRHGHDVHVVVGTSSGPLRDSVPDTVTFHDLDADRTLSAGVGLRRYLRRERPDVLISAISHANIVAALVARLTRPRTRIIVMHHNTTSISTRNTGKRLDRLLPVLCGLAYRLADRIIAVSRGVANDLAASSHLPINRIDVVANPIDYPLLRRRAQESPAPGTLPPGSAPLVVAAGRFETQKGFDILLSAAARATRDWRLVILGDGPLRAQLSASITSLGIADRVALPGFIANPYPYFREASVFALSSRWEGLPTVLVESLAFDLRIVATDCPSGPDEILDGVEGAELVPVDDAAALAAAIDRAVEAGPLTTPREQWRRYDSGYVMGVLSDIVVDVARAPG